MSPEDQRVGDLFDNNLRSALVEADLLLSHAASVGTKLSDEVVDAIVSAKQLIGKDLSDPATLAQQKKFWKARSVLADALAPVTGRSLDLTKRHFEYSSLLHRGWLKHFTFFRAATVTVAELSIRSHQWLTVSILMLLILIQAYYIIGLSVVVESKPFIDKAEAAYAEELAGMKKLLPLYAKYGRTPSTTAEIAAFEKFVETLPESDRKTYAEIAPQQRLLHFNSENTGLYAEHHIDVLMAWNRIWGYLLPAFALNEQEASNNAGVFNKQIADSGLVYKIQKSAEYALQILQKYVLPLLYGLLGASMFVMRSLAADIKDYTFSHERRVIYRLRLVMGALAGLVVGWLLVQSEPGTGYAGGLAKNLAPLSFSLLAGYSVELVFALMDKIINSLISPQSASKKR